jgi:hypothetical protein
VRKSLKKSYKKFLRTFWLYLRTNIRSKKRCKNLIKVYGNWSKMKDFLYKNNLEFLKDKKSSHVFLKSFLMLHLLISGYLILKNINNSGVKNIFFGNLMFQNIKIVNFVNTLNFFNLEYFFVYLYKIISKFFFISTLSFIF